MSEAGRNPAQTAGLYALFALGSTGANLLVQWGVFEIYGGRWQQLVALASGTAAGLLLKFVLDSLFVFHVGIDATGRGLSRFLLYCATGIATTALFWAVELTFVSALAVPWAAYLGGAVGLCAGYTGKYFLDARFVFRREAMQRKQCSFDPLVALVFVTVLGLYWFTSARSPGWVDATLLLEGVRQLQLGAGANTHNLFNVLGYIWLAVTPFLDPHRSLTLLCALLGSLTVLLTQLAAREMTGSRAASALAAAALALSQSLWWHSAMIEVYTLNTVLIAVMLLLVVSFVRKGGTWRLYAAFFAGGLGVSNHMLMGLYVPAFGVLLVMLVRQRRIRIWHAPLLLACAIAGALLFLVVFIRDVVLRGSLLGGLEYAAGGGFLSMMFPRGLSAGQRLFWALNYLFLLLWNYPSAAIVLAALGLPRLWRILPDRTAAAFFLVGLGAQVMWSANYLIWDMYAFSLPVYVMLALPLACGIESFLRRGLRQGRWAILATFALPLVLYPTFALWPGREQTIDRYISLYPESARLCGFWDPADYVFNPIRRWDRSVEWFAAAWIAQLPAGAHYWDDESKAAYPLKFYYQNVRGDRLDVTIHVVFGLLMTEHDALSHAEDIANQLMMRDSVFVSSVVEPERELLNQLYHLESPHVPLEMIRTLEVAELLRTFPRTRIQAFPLTSDGSLVIYQLMR